MRIGREWIDRHIPHGGRMALIDEVAAWDADSIRCLTGTHTRADNPLRAENRLGALCGVEYAAQAAAIHGALLRDRDAAGQGPVHPIEGYLAALRDIEIYAERLDAGAQELEIVASRIAALADGASYRYVLRQGAATLQSGRLTLRFAATLPDSPGSSRSLGSSSSSGAQT